MSGMYVYQLIDPKPINKGGPLHGVTTKYITKHGFPVAERDPQGIGNTSVAIKAEPGMVVIDLMYGYNLYHIDVDGEPHALNVKVELIDHEFPEEEDVEVDHLAGAITRKETHDTDTGASAGTGRAGGTVRAGGEPTQAVAGTERREGG